MGILMIVFAAIALVMGVIAILDIGAVLALPGVAGTKFGAILTAVSVLILVGAALDLAAGIFGVKYWNRPERAGVCVTWGAILIVVCAASLLLNIIAYANIPGLRVNFLNILTSFVMPALYRIAAIQCRNLGR